MAQQAARADVPPRSAPDLAAVHELEGLGRDWVVLRGCRLHPGDRNSTPTVLVHPGQGIAVLDVPPSTTPDAIEAVHSRLDAARFGGIFAGHLPVVHLRAAPRQLPLLAKLLNTAFAALPPLDLPGGDAWAGVAVRALLAEHPTTPRAADQEAFRGAADGARPPRTRARRRRGAALRKAAAFLLCLAALGGVVAAALKELPLPDGSTGIAAPTGRLNGSSTLPLSPVEAAAPLGAAVLPTPAPAPERSPPEPATPLPAASHATAPALEAPPTTSLPASTTAGAATPAPTQRTAPAAARRAEAPTQPVRKSPEGAAPPQQQQRRPSGGAEAPPTAASGIASPDAAPQRCGRIEARIASGAPIADTDMRFFNQACIRW